MRDVEIESAVIVHQIESYGRITYPYGTVAKSSVKLITCAACYYTCLSRIGQADIVCVLSRHNTRHQETQNRDNNCFFHHDNAFIITCFFTRGSCEPPPAGTE